MKLKSPIVPAVLLLSAIGFSISTAFAQGTAFTYQGRLNDGASPATGTYDLQFAIYDSTNNPGVLIAGPITNSATGVSNGFFTVTLDFGGGVFTGASNWLQIAVRTNGGGAFVGLAPRQQLTPVPYAIYAEGGNAAGLSGTLPPGSLGGTYTNAVTFNNGANDFDGTFTGQFFGSIFTGGIFTGSFIGSGSGLGDVWHTAGNFGTTPGVNFLGTLDNQALEIRVNNQRALRLEPANDPNVGLVANVIGGHPGNSVSNSIGGSVIAGGGGSGLANSIASTEGVIAGGYLNRIEGGNAHASAIGGGFDNVIQAAAPRSVIAGGHANRIGTNSQGSVVSGGENNSVGGNATLSIVGGGGVNTVLDGAAWSTIAGGYGNTVGDINTFIGGGWTNTIEVAGGNYSVIAGGQHNTIVGLADRSVIGGGGENVITGAYSFGVVATIAGGYANKIHTNSGVPTISGGAFNTIRGGNYNTIAGGSSHLAGNTNGSFASVGGGFGNNAEGNYSTVPGGRVNLAKGQYSFAAGRQAKATNDGAFVWADSTAADFSSSASDQFLVRANGGVFFATGAAGVNVDHFNLNNGDINYGLKFGLASGEGIASKRTSGGNQYGLDFYTQFTPRMTVHQSGKVGIGTNNPSATLHVVGDNKTNMALRISNGGISVAGAGVSTPTPAFIHLANATNILSGYITLIDHPLCNGDPGAILIVTQNWPAGGGVYNPHPVGVSYIAPQWVIFNEDTVAIPVNAAFNVLVIKP